MSEAIPHSCEEANTRPVQTAGARSFVLPVLVSLLLLFLLLLVAGVFFGGHLWQRYALLDQQQTLHKARLAELQAQVESAHQALGALQKRPDASDWLARLDNQQQQLQALQKKQQDEQRQLKQYLADTDIRQRLQRNEAFHQMRLAHLRLTVMQDVDGALLLLKNADELLVAQQDPASLATRKLLAEALQALAKLSLLDPGKLYLKLAALRTEAAHLNRSPPSFHPVTASSAEGDAAEGDAATSWWQRWSKALSGYVRIDFAADVQGIRPLLAEQTLGQARLALVLALEQAQWALLHRQPAVYQQALDQAGEVLTRGFHAQDSGTLSLQASIAELRRQEVAAPMPDLAPLLASMQRYMRQSRQPGEAQTEAEADASIPATEPAGEAAENAP